MKKLLAIILVAVMALSVLPFAASADETWAWEIKDDVLTITGTGVVGTSDSSPEDYPWNDDRATITEVVVGDGITEIGKNAFCHMDSLTSVTFGKDVTVLNTDAMAYCGALTDIVFGGPITTVGQGTIFGSGSIANVTITGQSKDQFLAVATVKPYNTGFETANIIVNGAPELVWPNDMTITPFYGEVENWSGATFFIAGFAATNESNATIVSKLKDGTYAMKVVLIDETAEETYTIPKYFFDHTEGGSKEFYSDNSFLRIAFCDYGIVPVVDHAYTLQFVITEDGEVRYNATSETGAFDSFNDAFKADGAIIPEEIPHPNGGVEPVDPPVDPVDPPQAGDATVMIAVLAVVALFGAAVVTKKVFVK